MNTRTSPEAILNSAEQGPSEPAAIRLLLVWSNDLVLAGLYALLHEKSGMTVVGLARNGSEALDGLRENPDVVLLELDPDAEHGMDVLADLCKIAPRPRVLIVTSSQNHKHHVRMTCLGAAGIVLKQQGAELLMKAIRKVHLGEVWINRTTMAEALAQLQDQPQLQKDPEANRISSLTTRERSVIALIGEGLRNREIGDRLFISEKTVRHYLTSIFGKLGVDDRLELMIYAYQQRLARLPARSRIGK